MTVGANEMTEVRSRVRRANLHARYRQGREALAAALIEVHARCVASDPAWIARVSAPALQQRIDELATLHERWCAAPASLPLYGLPFAVKDNIDVVDFATTAACPAFAYRPIRTAPAVQRLLDAGAVLIGKTNLDQFATGLVGVRSPFGICPNPFDARYPCGGSSSGSASVVARGLVSFALGTDTAGSGRVPAALTGLLGVKPSRGLISTRGVVPASRSLDCVSVFAADAAEADQLLRVLAHPDPEDPYSRVRPARLLPAEGLRVGMFETLDFAGDAAHEKAMSAVQASIAAAGIERVAVDERPFREAAGLLYEGPWVAERWSGLQAFHDGHADDIEPSVRAAIAAGAHYDAADAFRCLDRVAGLRREVEALWRRADVLLLPTTPTYFTIAAIEAAPQACNRMLGVYTNFANLLDLAAVSVPAGLRDDGLPFGITLYGPAGSDHCLLEFAARIAGGFRETRPGAVPVWAPPPGTTRLAVVGAHLQGLPLNHELRDAGARRVACTRTAPRYRLYALPDTQPPKPGMTRVAGPGHAVEVEVWDMPTAAFGEFVARVRAPLGIGEIELADGSRVHGFLCEAWAVAEARDISAHGGWRAYLAAGDGTTRA